MQLTALIKEVSENYTFLSDYFKRSDFDWKSGKADKSLHRKWMRRTLPSARNIWSVWCQGQWFVKPKWELGSGEGHTFMQSTFSQLGSYIEYYGLSGISWKSFRNHSSKSKTSHFLNLQVFQQGPPSDDTSSPQKVSQLQVSLMVWIPGISPMKRVFLLNFKPPVPQNKVKQLPGWLVGLGHYPMFRVEFKYREIRGMAPMKCILEMEPLGGWLVGLTVFFLGDSVTVVFQNWKIVGVDPPFETAYLYNHKYTTTLPLILNCILKVKNHKDMSYTYCLFRFHTMILKNVFFSWRWMWIQDALKLEEKRVPFR